MTVELLFPGDSEWIQGMIKNNSASLTNVAFNDELKSTINSFECQIIYSQLISQKLHQATDRIHARVFDHEGNRLFTGVVWPDYSQDIIETDYASELSLNIEDESYLLDLPIRTSKVFPAVIGDPAFSICNPSDTASSIIHQLLTDAGYTDLSMLTEISKTIQVFSTVEGETYREAIDDLLSEHGYVIDFDKLGRPYFIDVRWNDTSSAQVLLATEYNDASLKRSERSEEGIQVIWSQLANREERVYRAGLPVSSGLSGEDVFPGEAVAAGDYWPPDSDAMDIYQEFTTDWLDTPYLKREVRQIDINKNKDLAILNTSSHRLEFEDDEGKGPGVSSFSVDLEVYKPSYAQIRLQNSAGEIRKLKVLEIFAQTLYRKHVRRTYEPLTAQKTVDIETRTVFNQTDAEQLARRRYLHGFQNNYRLSLTIKPETGLGIGSLFRVAFNQIGSDITYAIKSIKYDQYGDWLDVEAVGITSYSIGSSVTKGVYHANGILSKDYSVPAIGAHNMPAAVNPVKTGPFMSRDRMGFYDADAAAWKLLLSSSGDAAFQGQITAASGSIGGWDIAAASLSKNNATLHSSGYLSLGAGNNIIRLDAVSTGYRMWAGNANAAAAPFSVSATGALKASNAIITGTINTGALTATGGTIAGWKIFPTYLQSADGKIRIDTSTNRFEVRDAVGIPKVAMGYLGGLSDPENRSNSLASSVYGFWTEAGDVLDIKGEMLLGTGGAFLLEQDASIDIKNSVNYPLMRFGTHSGVRGLHWFGGASQLDLLGSLYHNGSNFHFTDSIFVDEFVVSPTYASTTATSRTKFRVWDISTYGIGMDANYSFGGLATDYAMTFQMDNTSARGWWWGDDGHSNAQGAMALTTDGFLTVANGMRIGFGEGDTTKPSIGLQVNGAVSSTTLSTATVTATTSATATRYLNTSALGTNAANARNHFVQYNAGTAGITTGWIAAAFGDATANRVVIGQANSIAYMGAHDGNLNDWAPVQIRVSNPAGGYVEFFNAGTTSTSWPSIRLGPNNTWGEQLLIGAYPLSGAATVPSASVFQTAGNLHLDSKTGGGLFLNFYAEAAGGPIQAGAPIKFSGLHGSGAGASYTAYIEMNDKDARTKYRVWGAANYGIGMDSNYTFGGLAADYAMTFQMDNSSSRGWWWGDDGHSNAQGAMALTTDGFLTVANGMRIGYGEADTTKPSTGLQVNGNTTITGTLAAQSSLTVTGQTTTTSLKVGSSGSVITEIRLV